ncbi:hypothetical protein F4802DRAFT_594220 [Xylaria palmicola]|nr:hypothetical protein F4802DRAFT_594220 [Xylaria palmicola]
MSHLYTAAALAMHQATGHASDELFRYAYMLYIVRDPTTQINLQSLAAVTSKDWKIEHSNYVVEQVQNMAFLPCIFAETITRDEIETYLRYPFQMRDRSSEVLQKINPGPLISANPPSLLDFSSIQAVLCAEIWCTWASRSSESLPKATDYLRLFQPGTKRHLRAFMGRLESFLTIPRFPEFAEHIHGWFGNGVAILNASPDVMDRLIGLERLNWAQR